MFFLSTTKPFFITNYIHCDCPSLVDRGNWQQHKCTYLQCGTINYTIRHVPGFHLKDKTYIEWRMCWWCLGLGHRIFSWYNSLKHLSMNITYYSIIMTYPSCKYTIHANPFRTTVVKGDIGTIFIEKESVRRQHPSDYVRVVLIYTYMYVNVCVRLMVLVYLLHNNMLLIWFSCL